MKNKIGMGLWVALLAMCFCSGLHAQAAAPKKSKIPTALKADAKIPVEQARATAVKRVPGEIQEEELERENGKLVYSFDIKATGQKDITEVQVDAVNGSIVSVEKEDAANEATEKKQDAAKAKP
jgi:Peptidase propeptide and YPEB domain